MPGNAAHAFQKPFFKNRLAFPALKLQKQKRYDQERLSMASVAADRAEVGKVAVVGPTVAQLVVVRAAVLNVAVVTLTLLVRIAVDSRRATCDGHDYHGNANRQALKLRQPNLRPDSRSVPEGTIHLQRNS